MRETVITRILQLSKTCHIDLGTVSDSIDAGIDLSDGDPFDILGELDDEGLLQFYEEIIRISLE